MAGYGLVHQQTVLRGGEAGRRWGQAEGGRPFSTFCWNMEATGSVACAMRCALAETHLVQSPVNAWRMSVHGWGACCGTLEAFANRGASREERAALVDRAIDSPTVRADNGVG